MVDSEELRMNIEDNSNVRERDEDDDEINRRDVRQRVAVEVPLVAGVLVAIDRSLMTQPIMTRTNQISLIDLMNENPVNVNRNSRINLQLLRVIGNSNNGQSNSRAHIYGAYGRNRSQTSDVNYSRLFLCKVVSRNEGTNLVYMMESRNTNKLLWSRNPQFRDDGVIAIGTIFCVISPNPISNLMSNDIPMLETRYPVVVMRPPRLHIESRVELDVIGNTSKAFCLNGCTITIKSSTPEETNCSGLLCDKQRIHEIASRSNQGCGCYSMLSRRSTLVLEHSLEIESSDFRWNHYCEHYSSNKFSMLYQSSPFSSSVTASNLQFTDEYYLMVEKIESVMNYINTNGGFTVIGWYKRGKINDQSIVSETNNRNNNEVQANNQVDSGNISYHVCEIKPTNFRINTDAHPMQEALNLLKYDMTRLHHTGGNI
jgi:hypothetical protein